MLNPAKQIIETRLHSWKLFFESEQSEALGHGALLSANDPRLIHAGAPLETHDVDALLDAAVETGDRELMALAELVDLMALNYIMRTDDDMHTAMMQDDSDDATPAPVARTCPAPVTLDELDAALAGA
jgi:hypothetical protein